MGSWDRITLFRVQMEGSGTKRLFAEMGGGLSLLTSGQSSVRHGVQSRTGQTSILPTPSLPEEERNKAWLQKRDI